MHEASVHVVQEVSLAEVGAEGVPQGYLLCRFDDEVWCHSYTQGESLPESLSAGQTLWLMPAKPRHIRLDMSVGKAPMVIDIAVEFDPAHGSPISAVDMRALTWSGIEKLATDRLTELVARIGTDALRRRQNPAIERCRGELDREFRPFGLRCVAVSVLPAGEPLDAQASGDPNPRREGAFGADTAAREAEKSIKTAAVNSASTDDPTSLAASSSRATFAELSRMQQRVLGAVGRPDEIAQRLARVADQAMTRMTSAHTKLQRCQAHAEHRVDEPAGPVESATPMGVDVVVTERPSIWWPIGRQENDRRQIAAVRRSVTHCRIACEQAMRQPCDIVVLRAIRDWNDELRMTEQLVEGLEPVQSCGGAWQHGKGRLKEGSQLLQSAARIAVKLTCDAEGLFRQTPRTDAWQQSLVGCQRTTTRLHQQLLDRRRLR